MEIRGLGFIPLLLVFWCVAWLSASYTVTIVIGHKPALMYISGAGKVYPDNILFPIGFIGSSIAKSFGARPAAVQRVLLAVTWISCIGTMVMAAFPSDPVSHGIGSAMAFTCGCIYKLWQTILLYKVPGLSKKICHITLCACIMPLFHWSSEEQTSALSAHLLLVPCSLPPLFSAAAGERVSAGGAAGSCGGAARGIARSSGQPIGYSSICCRRSYSTERRQQIAAISVACFSTC
ncbi:DNA damage-regulated autophagy modulator protein 1-like isoform X1 [Dendropsophus ebraccatus]|uniref:DNA damage-regulated autophagy modulator protein 1-like isoform X1 n=1 Tax=Dendropsophus ebraccatus TaxID=150705 RepID=UPI003831C446